jgi:hypothetical protein
MLQQPTPPLPALQIHNTLILRFPAGCHSFNLLSHLAHLTSLTHLDLARSLTAAWRGQAVEVAAGDLAHITGCTALQVRRSVYMVHATTLQRTTG